MANTDQDKAERLAAALRENLRRRKAQGRDNAKPTTRSGGSDGPSPSSETH